MKRGAFTEMICFLLIFLFAYAALSKLFNHTAFQAQLSIFPVIKPFAILMSWALPFTELFIAFLLLIPNLRLAGLYASSVLLFVFTMYLVSMVVSNIKLPCSCGGVISNLSWKQHILFNMFFISISIAGIYVNKRAEIKSSMKSKNKEYQIFN